MSPDEPVCLNPRTAELLTAENFAKGFLVDQELMAGVTEDPESKGQFVAFVLRLDTGDYLGYEAYPALDTALGAINRIPRSWSFESLGGCGDGGCKGTCSTGSCE